MSEVAGFLSEDGAERACADIFRERVRQVVAEGHLPADDDGHDTGALARAAASHALRAVAALFPPDNPNRGVYERRAAVVWPFRRDELKHHEPRRHLVIAGALTVAEIERRDRAAARAQAAAQEKAAPCPI